MNIEQTFGVCVVLTSGAFGAAVVYREFTYDRRLWRMAHVLGTLGFLCWLCFGYHAIQECEIAYRAAAHWKQMASVQGAGIGIVVSQREFQADGGSALHWGNTTSVVTRPVIYDRAESLIARDGLSK